MSDQIFMSKEGRLKLEAELKKLKYEERPAIVAEIKRAMELGDLSENAEYHAAKERQKVIEGRIAEIQIKLTKVQIVDAENMPTDKVYLFAKVLIEDLEDGEEILYTIAPPDEADINQDIISVESPIAKAMLGKGVGETFEIDVPAGKLQYKIKKISR